MKILFLSDLHNEFAVFDPQKIDADLVVTTGDIGVGTKGAHWAIETFKNIPIIYIAGNHEYYGNILSELNNELLEISKTNDNFFFLENDIKIINGVRFLGCTLWTDFFLFGEAYFNLCFYKAEQTMNDFRKIRIGSSESSRKIRSEDMISIHKKSIDFLNRHLSESYKGTTIILSHHAPLKRSVPEKHSTDLLSSAFASNLEELIFKYKPEYWFHGHTHHNVDYIIDKTRVISNQRGYHNYEIVENFKENLIINISE